MFVRTKTVINMDVTIGDKTFSIDDGLLYSKSHQWVKIDGGVALVGLSDYAQTQLGEISLVDLSTIDTGTEVSQATFDGNDPSSDPVPDVSIESAKTVADVYSPISGAIAAVNEDLEDEPEKINEDPYGSWLLKITPSGFDGEKGNLMDAAAYADFLKTL